jgi:hypothetical protein
MGTVSLARAVTYGLGVGFVGALFAIQFAAVPLAWAIVLGVPLGAVVMLGVLLSGAMDANWEPAPAPGVVPSELLASTLATRLAEAATDQNRFTTRVQPRLRRLVVATLRGRPGTSDLTSLDDPRARQVLDPDLYRLLTAPDATLPDPRTLAALLDQLEGS